MTTTISFVGRCDGYAAKRGIARSYLSKLLFDDGKVLDALAQGRADITVRRLGRAARTLGEMERALAVASQPGPSRAAVA